jgi:hypothetical protein
MEKITHETLLEHDWKCTDIGNQRYEHTFYPNLTLFLSKNYGIDNNYMIQILAISSDFDTLKLNINCITINDLRGLEALLQKASAVGLIKRLLINY